MRSTGRAGRVSEGTSVCPNRPLIAIVDDDEAVREALSELLQVDGLVEPHLR